MPKPNLQAVTPVGTFTRVTATPYAFVVVWNSPRCMRTFLEPAAHDNVGAGARWVKDQGFGVTWHGTEKAAQAATVAYKWDNNATLVGVFPVSRPEA
jgi:hypothetical protein